MPKYASIVFIHGDEADEPLDILYSRDDGHAFPYYLGATAESIDTAFAYLRQWDYGEPAEESDTAASGLHDEWWERDGYRMSANLGMGYIGLERIIAEGAR